MTSEETRQQRWWDTGCIQWSGAKTRAGYGVRRHSGVAKYVHRLEYERVHGAIPDGMLVMHICDNPSCYNIEHLRLGTDADNHADKARKGRVPNRKLTPEQVRVIRESKASCSRLAAAYGVSRECIQHVKRRRTYAVVA